MDEQIDINTYPEGEQVRPMVASQDTLFSLEEFTVNTAKTLDQLRQSLKVTNQMLNEAFSRNQVLIEIEQKIKDAQSDKKETKNVMLQQTELAALTDKAKKLKDEIREQTMSQSDYALEYARISGRNEIEKDGVTYEIIRVAKLIKRMS